MRADLSPVVAAAAHRFRRAVAERFGARLREIRLFGSHARGEARADSDVDLLVWIDDLTWREAVDVIDLGTEEEWASGVLLAPLPKATAEFDRSRAMETGLARDVDRDGVVL